MYTPEELKDVLSKHLRREEEIQADIIARQVLDEQGLQVSQEEIFVEQQIKNLLSTGRKGHKCIIIVNQANL